MDCEGIRDLLPAHAAGELDSTERALAEAHLAACAACARELDRHREARAGLASLRVEPEAPPGTWKDLWSGVRDEMFPRPPSRAILFMDSALRLAAVLLIGVGVGALSYQVARPMGAPVPVATAPSMMVPDDSVFVTPASMSIRDLDETARVQLGVRGAEVVGVEEEGPARLAGLRPRDILITINGRPFESLESLLARIRGMRGPLRFGYLRQGQRHEVEVRLPGE